jgi:hypothetical protein
MVMKKFEIHANYLNVLDSDANVTMDRHVARIGSRGIEAETEEKV